MIVDLNLLNPKLIGNGYDNGNQIPYLLRMDFF